MNKKIGRLSIFMTLMVVFGLIAVPLASAVPPTNDIRSRATVIGAIPYTATQSTVEATISIDDPSCSGRSHTVWYTFTPTESITVEANTFGSNFDTTLSAYRLIGGSLVQAACNDDSGSLQSSIVFNAVAGETIYLMAGSFGSGPGGNLVLSVDRAAGPPTVVLEIDEENSTVNTKDGVATIRGTVNCSSNAKVSLYSILRQDAGRGSVVGSNGYWLNCNGESAWSMVMKDPYGRFNAANQNLLTTQLFWSTGPYYGSQVLETQIKLKNVPN